MKTFPCTGNLTNYPVHLSNDPTLSDASTIIPRSSQQFIVIDRQVNALHPKALAAIAAPGAHVFFLDAAESNKSLDTLNALLAWMFSHAPNRDDVVVAIGGGLVLNTAGMLAGLVMRGIPFVHVPTTLTGQIDAAFGSKQAVNFNGAKNWVGMYADPVACYVNPVFLATATGRDICSQAIEGVKLCLATSAELLDETLPALPSLWSRNDHALEVFVEKMVQVKLAVLETDLHEHRIGMSLLYGHTVGHALEMLAPERINHGEGVGLGMLVAAKISYLLGFCERELVELHAEILRKMSLPAYIPSDIDPYAIVAKLAHNKKNYAGDIRFVLLGDVGHIIEQDGMGHVPVAEDIILKAVDDCLGWPEQLHLKQND